MTKLLHLSASPRSQQVRVPGAGRDLPRPVRRACTPTTRSSTSTSGTARSPSSGRRPPAAKMDVFAGLTPTGPGADAWAAAAGDVRALRGGRQVPVQRPDVERRHPLHPQAVHRRGQPARHGVRLRPGRGLHRPGHRQEGRRALHQRRLRRRAAGRRSAPTSRCRTCATGSPGPAITDISEVEFRPNLATADAEAGRQLAHAQARDLAKVW